MAGHETLDLGAGVRIPAPQLLILLPFLFSSSLSSSIRYSLDSPPEGEKAYEVPIFIIEGNTLFSSREIERILTQESIKKSHPFHLEGSLVRLKKAYQDEGFLLVEMDVEEGKEPGHISLAIHEGIRFRVGEIRIEGVNLFPVGEIVSWMETRRGNFFKERVFERDVEEILRRYEERGFPYCQVNPTRFQLREEEGEMDFGLRIDEGPLVRIEEIRVKGNEVTREEVILREFRFKKGEVYSQKRIDRGRKGLESLPFLKVKGIELVSTERPDRGVLRVEIKEGRMNRVEGGIGVKPRGEEEREIFGSVDILSENFLGTGREIQGRWDRLTSFTSTLQLGYKEPWLFRIPLHGSLRFLHSLQDTQYTETHFQGNLEIPLSTILSGTIGFGGRRIIPDPLYPAPRSTQYEGALGAKMDTREERWNPRKGFYYQLETESGARFNYPTSSFPQVEKRRSRGVRWRYGFHHWFPLVKSPSPLHVLYFAVQGGEVRTNEEVIQTYDLIKMGGATSLRGYREQAFWGSRVVWGNLEYRYILTREGRIFLFLDGGYYEDEEVTREFLPREFPPKTFLPGYGFGISLDSSLGLFGFAYGLGKGDSPFEGKVHFTLKSEF